MNQNEDDSMKCYQYYNIQDANNHQEEANIKRNCFIQYYITCNKLFDGAENLNSLDSKLEIYSDIVDNQSGLNNYATNIEVLTSDLMNKNLLHWNNELDKVNISSIVEPLKCCSSDDINKKELQTLLTTRAETSPSIFVPKVSPKPVNPTRPYYDHTRSNEPKSNYGTNQRNTDGRLSYPASNGNTCGAFKTARDELEDQNIQKYGSRYKQNISEPHKKCLGTRRGPQSKFISPARRDNDEEMLLREREQYVGGGRTEEVVDERLKNIEPRMVELIKAEIMNTSTNISWDDIAGLEFAKMVIREIVVLPMLRPDIFTGLRRPPKGMLLFGPPGTGKTLIGKCIASQSNSTFFSISASSLTSKWIGDGEKMVRAMFAVARCYQPAVIFIDEIDSLLSQRNETEHESTRRLKTEFLVQLDGAATGNEDRILVIGATNRPQELDEAARRRFVKRLYIPLPEKSARFAIVKHLMHSEKHNLTEENIMTVAELSEGYSGADMMNLCSEASLGPIRAIDISQIHYIETDKVRAILMEDFQIALDRVRATVSPADLKQYVEWNQTYGTGNY